MTDEYPAATCPRCGHRIGHPGHCPNCYSATGALIQRAIDIGNHVHQGQFRKGGSRPPFIIHPIAVLNRMHHWGITEGPLLAAAPTHDCIEDVHPVGDRDQVILRIKDGCGPVTLAYVNEVTFLGGDKVAYFQSFADKSIGSVLLKLADRLCNVDDYWYDPSTREYSKKYLHKADALFKIFHDRERECVEGFGEPVFSAAFDDLKSYLLDPNRSARSL